MLKYRHNQSLLFLQIPILTAVLMVLVWRCAAVGPPTGGPKDTTPPFLISADPPSETLRISSGTEITLEFSEYIDENSVDAGFTLSPVSELSLELEYRDDVIIVTLPDSLIVEQTYILTIGRQLKDEHGVELAEPVHLAYSTGDKIEQGIIEGYVYFNTGPAAIHLWDLSLVNTTDSIFAERPHFITDADDNGQFGFQFLRPAVYQILAVSRSGAGLGLNTARVEYGVFRDKQIDMTIDSLVTGVNLPMWKEPQPLRLLRGEWNGNRWGRLSFNNDLQQPSQRIMATGDDSITTIIPVDNFIDPLDSSALIVISRDSIIAYKITLRVDGMVDIFDQVLDSAVIMVRVPSERDTAHLALIKPPSAITIKSNQRQVDMVLNKPVANWPGSKALAMVYDDSIAVAVIIDSVNALQAGIMPLDGWLSDHIYNLELTGDSLTAHDGNPLADSLVSIKIKVGKPIGRGGIEGIVNLDRKPVVLRLTAVENSSYNQISFVNSGSLFRFDNIPEGYYNLMVFQDRNQNQRFDHGTAFPFMHSEWFYLYPDTVEVRTNWIIELPMIESKEVQ